jgi:hypothetical protein
VHLRKKLIGGNEYSYEVTLLLRFLFSRYMLCVAAALYITSECVQRLSLRTSISSRRVNVGWSSFSDGKAVTNVMDTTKKIAITMMIP